MLVNVRRYRCIHDIIHDILSTIADGERGITELCLNAGIPVDRGRKIVDYLVACGLLTTSFAGKRITYQITVAGYQWIGTYKRLNELLRM